MRTIAQLYQNNGFINFIDSYNALRGKWVHNADAPVCDLNLLDSYILLNIGNSKLARIVDNDKIYDSVRTCLNANEYKLNAMWDSTLLEYNPIENYDRYEEETTDGTSNNGERSTTINNGARLTTINNGERSTTVNNGAREESVENGERSTTINAGEHKTLTKVGERDQTNSNGAQSNTNISANKTTAFDSADYGKATDKTETTDTTQAYTDTIHTDEATDTTTQNAYTDSTSQDAYTDTTKVKASTDTTSQSATTDTTSQSATTDTTTQNAYTDTNNAHRVAHIHGNIGVIDSATMIGNYRKISNYNFYDKIVEILEQYITEMNYELEDF